MRVARVFAQAKINVNLDVFDRDPSGYHPIDTLVQRIDLADEVVVRTGGHERTLDCAGPQMPVEGLGPTDRNLAFRAATAFASRAGWPSGFAIEITKNIPVGGGLGGGSADAGAVLRALQALAPHPLAPSDLHGIAASLGSDVPFLASDFIAAHGTGRGEILASCPSPYAPPASLLLVVPSFAIATADAYRWLDEDRAGAARTQARAARGRVQSPDGGNDFEPVLERRFPTLKAIRDTLSARGAVVTRIAGSGSTVFGVFSAPVADWRDLPVDGLVIPSQTSSRVVQVEVQ